MTTGEMMRKLIRNKFLKNESGATAIEYALIASLISVVIIGSAAYLGGQVTNTFQFTADELGKVNTSSGSGPTPD